MSGKRKKNIKKEAFAKADLGFHFTALENKAIDLAISRTEIWATEHLPLPCNQWIDIFKYIQ